MKKSLLRKAGALSSTILLQIAKNSRGAINHKRGINRPNFDFKLE
jgi:hypothetical protein